MSAVSKILRKRAFQTGSRRTRAAARREIAEWSATIQQFHESVNLTALQLENFLASEAGRSLAEVAVTAGTGSDRLRGYQFGRKIVALLRKTRPEYDDADISQMRRIVRVIGHLQQQPAPELDHEHSNWRYTLMTWGYDPLKRTGRHTLASHFNAMTRRPAAWISHLSKATSGIRSRATAQPRVV